MRSEALTRAGMVITATETIHDVAPNLAQPAADIETIHDLAQPSDLTLTLSDAETSAELFGGVPGAEAVLDLDLGTDGSSVPKLPAIARQHSLTVGERETLEELVRTDPAAWMERHFYIEDPRDPFTGEQFHPGPIRLHPLQKRILRGALTKVNGTFPFSTILYSTIKKSGKTRLAAGVASWYAATQAAYNEIYCLANDGAQSHDRILSAVRKSVILSRDAGGKSDMSEWRTLKNVIELPNGTFIRALPCDAEGQAGSNPGLTVWSEMWGYATTHKERLWTEMTIPPTRWGQALRWVESYAGYTGESHVLENLHAVGTAGMRHPMFPDLPVYISPRISTFTYWDEGDSARRMPWQNEHYYAQESAIMAPVEFDRIHRNMWADPITKAIPIEWWDQCRGPVPPLNKRTKVCMAIDASVSGDCTACVLVSRAPNSTKERPMVMVRAVRVWVPPKGHKMDLEETVFKTVLEWKKIYNLKEVAYDPYQLHNMMTRLRKMKKVKLHEFQQAGERSKADKQLADMVQAGTVVHDGNATLRSHVDNAQARTQSEKYRFIKPGDKNDSPFASTKKPIDALVALSMATDRCLHLRL